MQLDRCKPYEGRDGDLESWVIQGHHAFLASAHSLLAMTVTSTGAWRPPLTNLEEMPYPI